VTILLSPRCEANSKSSALEILTAFSGNPATLQARIPSNDVTVASRGWGDGFFPQVTGSGLAEEYNSPNF